MKDQVAESCRFDCPTVRCSRPASPAAERQGVSCEDQSTGLLAVDWEGRGHMKEFIAICCVLCISACAARGPVYTPAPTPAAADALVYIYRPGGFALGARDAYFYVDDVNVADLSAEGYTWFHLPAGEYTMRQKWPLDVTFGKKTLELRVRWLPGRMYFYRLDTSVRVPYVEWRLAEVPSDVAMTQIRNCKLQPAFGIEKLLEQSSRKCATCS